MEIRAANYSAIIALPTPKPLLKLGICIDDDFLTGIEFLPVDTADIAPINTIARMTVEQLQQYFNNAHYRFSLPLRISATEFQQRVCRQLQSIAPGSTCRYGELARQLGSSARAIGGACRRNPIPVVIPCHRVLSKNDDGGYCGEIQGDYLKIKQWLLAHETGSPRSVAA